MRVEFSKAFHEDMARIDRHLVSHGAQVERRISEIYAALKILERNPYIGHEVEDGFRELVIGERRNRRGFIALYTVVVESEEGIDEPDEGMVAVIAIRSQNESDYH